MEVKLAILLGELNRLDDDTLELVVVSDFDIAAQREVLALGMALKAIVGQDSSQVRVSCKEDAVHIPSLALKPVGSPASSKPYETKKKKAGGVVIPKQGRDRRDGQGLVGVSLDADARIVAMAEHVVDDLETVRARGVVNASDIDHLLELGRRVVLQETARRTSLKKTLRAIIQKKKKTHVITGITWSGATQTVSSLRLTYVCWTNLGRTETMYFA